MVSPASCPPPDVRAADARLRLALAVAAVGTWDWELATDRLSWCEAHHALCGVAPGGFDGRLESFLALVHPEDRPGLEAALAEARATGAEYRHTFRVRRLDDGRVRWLEGRGVFLRAHADARTGDAVWGTGVIVDVTAYVAADAARRASEERLALALDAAEDGLWDWNVETGAMWFSPRWYAMLGYAPDEVAPRVDAWGELVHPDDRPHARAAFVEHLEGRTPQYEAEYRVRRRDGTWAWVLARGKVVARDAAGRALRAVGTQGDVTTRRAHEATIAEQRTQLDLALTAARMGSWQWDVATDTAVYSHGMGPLLGEALGGRHVGVTDFLARVHPDDRGALRAAMDDALAGRRAYATECRVRWPDGSEHVLANRARVFRDAAGHPMRVTGVSHDVTEARRREAALVASEAQLRLRTAQERALSASNPLGLCAADLAVRVTYANGRMAQLHGLDDAAVRGHGWLDAVHPEDRDALIAGWTTALAAAREFEAEYRVVHPDGTVRWMHGRSAPLRDGDGPPIGCVNTIEDVTERRELEARLRQAQRLEAVGQLAGGVAHDFNNLLTVITGNLDFAQHGLPADHPVQGDLTEIAEAAERARTLVRQLLAFGRKQVLAPRPLDLAEVVRDAERLLRRVIGEEIALETALTDALPAVRADRGQLEQVLMNLAVNARDAMLTARHGRAAGGGTLLLTTDACTLAGAESAAWGLAPGPYVRLVVRDTGHGMTEAERARAFEPFFTTKPVGAGTGLGLATVYGIVQQSGGAIRVASAPGAGTAFTILLPALPPGVRPAPEAPAASAPRGRGTVLLVEDEAPVRATTRRLLEQHGYTVLEARHGGDALGVWRAHRAAERDAGRDAIRAVVTDLCMPVLGGRELAVRLRADRPMLPVLYVSGYAQESAGVAAGPMDAHVEKPFTAATLVGALTALLGEDGEDGVRPAATTAARRASGPLP